MEHDKRALDTNGWWTHSTLDGWNASDWGAGRLGAGVVWKFVRRGNPSG